VHNPEALAISPEIREVKRGRKKSVRQPPDQFGLWLSLVERLVRDNGSRIISTYPHPLFTCSTLGKSAFFPYLTWPSQPSQKSWPVDKIGG
jgi:hypothetical protein